VAGAADGLVRGSRPPGGSESATDLQQINRVRCLIEAMGLPEIRRGENARRRAASLTRVPTGWHR
jgi:hypothetical protein